MITHLADTRGLADHGWLKSRHTFSFAEYYNPERMGFGALRVINDDSVAPGMGFGTHPHRDMEIISIPLEGALQHKDSEGNESVIRKGEVQIMSAGTGILHSEYNASSNETVKFLQIWVMPEKLRVKPRYEQKALNHSERQNKIATVVSPDGRGGSVTINQNAFFSLTDLDEGKRVTYERQAEGNGVYIFILKGEVEVEGAKLKDRDGVGIKSFKSATIKALSPAEVLLMEVPVI
ncbi:MAG: pirin family protein [Bacteriovoracaceae bacterium]|nr:pirin family protein [Bacteriovoracaceae bacterium]